MSKTEELFDKRVLDLYMREGTVSDADYARFIKSLQDNQKNVELVNLEDLAPASYLRSALGFEKENPDQSAPEKGGTKGKGS